MIKFIYAFLFLLFILFCFVVFFFKRNFRGAPLFLDELPGALTNLRLYGGAMSSIVIQSDNEQPFTQFRALEKNGKNQVVLSIPYADWNEEYIEQFETMVDHENLEHQYIENDGMRFLEIFVGDGVDFATSLNKRVWLEIYGAKSATDKFRLRVNNLGRLLGQLPKV